MQQKTFKWDWVSTLDFIRNIQTNLEWSCTMVRKYLWPFKEVIWYGPQILTCIREKGEKECESLLGKY